jgi:hypothetical protein
MTCRKLRDTTSLATSLDALNCEQYSVPGGRSHHGFKPPKSSEFSDVQLFIPLRTLDERTADIWTITPPCGGDRGVIWKCHATCSGQVARGVQFPIGRPREVHRLLDSASVVRFSTKASFRNRVVVQYQPA